MKKINLLISLMVFTGGILASQEYQIRNSVFGAGGQTVTDTTQYRLFGTAGQPLIGYSQGDTTNSLSGFWYAAAVTTVDIAEDVQLPKEFKLYQNYPNPFNPSTAIAFDLPERSKVRLTIYNVLGQPVAELTSKTFEPGHHKIIWNGKNQSGSRAASGLYIYRLQTDKHVKVKKMLLVK